MMYLSRLGTLTLMAGGMLSAPFLYAGGASLNPPVGSNELLLSSSQGYLGVVVNDVDNDRAAALKLKEARGAEITIIDQDAPAAKAGLRVHDVVIQLNGQRIEGIEQFRRMLREIPPGRTVSMIAMRDGQPVTLNAQLADRAAIASRILDDLDGDLPAVAGDNAGSSQVVVVPGSGKRLSGHSNGFLGVLDRNRYYVGVEVQPLTTQLAEYFGVRNGTGVLVGSVFPNSPGAVAGLKAADVIQKVNGQPIVTLADWEHAIRVNHGKQVQVTLIRDKKEQTLSMIAGEAKNSSRLEAPQFGLQFDLPDASALAQLRGELAGLDADAIARQAEEAAKSIDTKDIDTREMTKEIQQALDASRQQAQDYGKQMQDYGKQMEQLRQALQSLRLQQMD